MQGIDRVVQRVKAMYEPVEATMFNIFDYGNAAEWKAVKAAFYADNEDIKSATRELIDTSFRKLRSAEGACDLLQNFKSIKSKGAIQKQVRAALVWGGVDGWCGAWRDSTLNTACALAVLRTHLPECPE